MAVTPMSWRGRCDLCGEWSPEVRGSAEEAQQDADECPCREEEAG